MASARAFLLKMVRLDSFDAALAWVIFAVVALWLLTSASPLILYIAGLTVIYTISALGLDWIQGRAGQVSIGNAAFMAVGAYLTAGLMRTGVSPLLALLASAFAGAFVGLVIGLPALRLRGIYLAFSTLALQFIVVAAGTQFEQDENTSAGLSIQHVVVAGIHLEIGKSFLLALLVVFVVVVVCLQNLYRRAPGRAWLVVKESEIAASVMGINTVRWKLAAFVGSSALISVSGSLLALYTGNVTAATFSLAFAITFVAMLIIGGEGSIAGIVLAAILLTALPYVLTQLTQLLPEGSFTGFVSTQIYIIDLGIYGLLLLAFLLFQPRGIGGMLDKAGRNLRRWAAATDASSSVVHSEEGPGSPGGEGTAGALTVQVMPEGLAAGDGADREIAGTGQEILRVTDLNVVYRSGAHAVQGVDLHVNAGEVVAVLGRNGVGKTSTLRAISGFMAGESVRVTGNISLLGEDITAMSPGGISKRGAILVPERDKVFPGLTVADHLRLARTEQAEVDRIIGGFPALKRRFNSPAGLLSGGERQMLALALAWSLQPQLLLIDELSLGLGPGIVKGLISAVDEFRRETQVPILLVEQSIGSALEIADRVYILEAGRVARAAAAADVSRDYVATASLVGAV